MVVITHKNAKAIAASMPSEIADTLAVGCYIYMLRVEEGLAYFVVWPDLRAGLWAGGEGTTRWGYIKVGKNRDKFYLDDGQVIPLPTSLLRFWW